MATAAEKSTGPDTTEPIEQESRESKERSRFDEELTAIGRILRILEDLPAEGQHRALCYLNLRCRPVPQTLCRDAA